MNLQVPDPDGSDGRSAHAPAAADSTNKAGFSVSNCRPPQPPSAPSDGDEVAGDPHHLKLTNEKFLAAIFTTVSDDAKPLVCSIVGDPNEASGWFPKPAETAEQVCRPTNNNYFNCSTFLQTEGSPATAKKEAFAGYHVLVLDDVGTKVDRAKLDGIEPSWRLETSPCNEQVGFIIEPPITELGQLEELQERVVAAGLCDPGAKGASRWMRLPVGINGKKKYEADGRAFCCRLIEWHPGRRWTAEQLVSLLSLPGLPAKAQRSSRVRRDDEVCTFPSAENPVVAELKSRRLYKRQLEPGKHDITCPWASEHTDGLDTGACYWEPDDAFPAGGFKCQHSHGDRLHLSDVLKHLDVDPVEAQNRPVIRLIGGAFDRVIRAAEEALAATGRIYQSGGAIVALHEDRATGELRIDPFSDQRLKRELSKVAIWQKPVQGGWSTVDPPQNYVTGLFKAQQYDALPELKGLARQPYFGADGELVLTAGYNPKTAVYGSFDPAKFKSLDTSREGAERALGELSELLEEFAFAADHDRSAGLSAILTAAARPSLPLAPAFNITASCPGSGKSYLADLLAAFATSGQAAKASYPATAEEATKAVLSHLIPGPAALIYDDMAKDWAPFGSINRMLTSEAIADRLLMTNRVQEASTRTLIIGTGNNIEPLRDLRRRVLSIRLQPLVANPALLSYKGRPVERVRADRGLCVSLALQIIEAWRQAGSPKTAEFAVASFGAWSDMCREPLIWLGLPDPATRLKDQLKDDPDDQVLHEFMVAWHELRGERPTKVRELIVPMDGAYSSDRLQDALAELPVCDGFRINQSKLGWYIKNKSGRIVDGLMIEPAPCSERRAWRVVRVGAAPPLPPSKGVKVGPPVEPSPD